MPQRDWEDMPQQWLRSVQYLQQGALDLVSGGNVLDTVSASDLAAVASDMVSHPVESLRCLVPDERTPIVVEEFRNKAEVFSWVRNAQTIMNLPDPSHYRPLIEMVYEAYRYDPFPALWYVEGLGHYYADGFHTRGERQDQLLTGPRTADLPPRSLTMLHAGTGLSFGDRLLTEVGSNPTTRELRSAIRHFVRLCENNSREGYTGAAFESLGLVARVFHSDLVADVEEAVEEEFPQVLPYFWHGFGRGMYFSFRHFLPFCRSTAKALHECRSEPRYGMGKRNAVAGFAWGLTMVNLESPQVLNNIIGGQNPDDFEGDAFSYGVWSSILMRQNVTPAARFIRDFLDYEPPRQDCRRWDAIVARPVRWAFNEVYPNLLRSRQFERLFRYGGVS
jgi:hypothetical protein